MKGLLQAAELCKEAYLDETPTFDCGDTQALMDFDDRGNVLLAFRGTEPDNLRDWATDAKFRMVETPIGMVHRGFWEAASEVMDDIKYTLRNIDKDQRIIATGHSLGGALANLCAVLLDRDGHDVRLVTFGAPRVFGAADAKIHGAKLHGRAFRVVNNNDVVTRVPPRVFGYSHFGNLLYIDHDGVLHTHGGMGWWDRFWDRIEGRLDDFLDIGPDGIKDHAIDRYIEAARRAES
jgi:triacylglycerol lipase